VSDIVKETAAKLYWSQGVEGIRQNKKVIDAALRRFTKL